MARYADNIVGLRLCLEDGMVCTITAVEQVDVTTEGHLEWFVKYRTEDGPDQGWSMMLSNIAHSDGAILLDPTDEEIREHQRTAPWRAELRRLKELRDRENDIEVPF